MEQKKAKSVKKICANSRKFCCDNHRFCVVNKKFCIRCNLIVFFAQKTIVPSLDACRDGGDEVLWAENGPPCLAVFLESLVRSAAAVALPPAGHGGSESDCHLPQDSPPADRHCQGVFEPPGFTHRYSCRPVAMDVWIYHAEHTPGAVICCCRTGRSLSPQATLVHATLGLGKPMRYCAEIGEPGLDLICVLGPEVGYFARWRLMM